MHAAAELRAILPDRVSRHIDWDSLQAVHASFVDAALNQRHGDLMFSARLVEGHEVYLWLLFEHQRPVVPPEIAKTMDSYEKTLERMYIEKFTRLAREEGRNEGQQELLLRQLARHFGTLPEAVTAQVMTAGREELERWSDRILDAASLDDVFAPH